MPSEILVGWPEGLRQYAKILDRTALQPTATSLQSLLGCMVHSSVFLRQG